MRKQIMFQLSFISTSVEVYLWNPISKGKIIKGFLWTLRHSSNGIAQQGEEHSLYPWRILLLAK